MVNAGYFLTNWSLQSNSVTRQVTSKKTQIDEKFQNSKNQMRHFEEFTCNVSSASKANASTTLYFWRENSKQ